MSGHLTSEEMDAMLMRPETMERPGHLQECGACAEELETLRGSLRDLRGAVMASAAEYRRTAVMPAPVQRTPRAMWSLVAATALLCVAGPVVLHQRTGHVPVASVKTVAAQGAVSDEQLMSDIQEDLGSNVPQAMLPLTAKDATAGASGSNMNTRENE
jgi:hypothetical protein